MAANGPRSLRLAARFGAGWVTTGPKVDSLAEWFDAVGALSERLTKTLADAGRDAEGFGRYLNLDSSPQFSMESAGAFEDLVGRAAELGFTDVISHWPRPEGVYAGRREVLEQVATEVIPRLRRDLA
jgi:alkanesulfonate monooxygenase SsuD/methylene tetrahydromethanopterin reductase-like flavin-dependent oxidoreductase (luciferase family)